jgi:formate dehydrogenase subunit gamma
MDTDTYTLIDSLLAARQTQPGALLPVLHDIQDRLGYVPPEAVPDIARALNLSRAEVHGVISYYHHFRQTPPPRHVVRLCRAEACQARGSEALAAHAEARLRGSEVALEPVYCLGLCASGPAVQIGEARLHARLTPDKFDALIAGLEAQP